MLLAANRTWVGYWLVFEPTVAGRVKMSPGFSAVTFRNLFVRHVPAETDEAINDAHFMAEDQAEFVLGSARLLRNICAVAPVIATCGEAHWMRHNCPYELLTERTS